MEDQEQYHQALKAVIEHFRRTKNHDALLILTKAKKIEFSEVSYANELDPTWEMLHCIICLPETEYWQFRDDAPLLSSIKDALRDKIPHWTIKVGVRLDRS